MQKVIFICLFLLSSFSMKAENRVVTSPNGKTIVKLVDDGGLLNYQVEYDGMLMLEPSGLGLRTDIDDFTKDLKFVKEESSRIEDTYTMDRTKASKVHYTANKLEVTYSTVQNHQITIVFQVSDNNVAYRYLIPQQNSGETKIVKVLEEASSFKLPQSTTTFLSPQITPMTGWKRSKPSYEEEYVAEAKLSEKSQFGVGYTFPCLFHVGNEGWVLISETGVDSHYCASRLSDWNAQRGYTIAFPQEGENNGVGSAFAAFGLPGVTPWRTITVGASLKPIVETTIPFDVVKPLYDRKYSYKPGRYTWSWLVWQDNSINYNDQVSFIDLASRMGYEYCLVDGLWDESMGHSGIEKLSSYAQDKGVNLMLWYNSNGYANDAPQGPRDIMNNSINRKKEMAWMQKNGIKGIKVDFFGGDKQETIKLYEDILSDANDYGLYVIFHGATMPRGWERMYPNYIASEAALASENVFFSEHHAKKEGFELTMHPFCRNTLGAFDWGGVIMNRYMSRDNKSRHPRYTSDVFEMATAITNQVAFNCVEITPESEKTLSDWEIDFLKKIPSQCDETRFLAGYPTKYFCVARRYGDTWMAAGINGTEQPIKVLLDLPEFAGKTVKLLLDKNKKKGQLVADSEMKQVKVGKNGKIAVVLQPMGGVILCE
ncbi:MAG: glycoside hydrolase family 97 catalytic domain-containing protein [Prevotella sp.]|nr:glycoside hydrolase family 97 catalytic domain-containing protein [Prevotella sp.]